MKKFWKMTLALSAIFALALIEGLVMFSAYSAHGAALSDGLAPTKKAAYSFPARMYAGVIYRGGLVAVTNGIAIPAANLAAARVIGVADYTVDNTPTSADYKTTRTISVSQGIYAFANVKTGVDASTNAVYSLQVSDVGKPAYVVDDQTVGASSNALYTVAGTVAYVEPDLKFVWVDVGKAWAETVAVEPFDLPSATTGLASGRLYIVNTATITNGVGIVP